MGLPREGAPLEILAVQAGGFRVQSNSEVLGGKVMQSQRDESQSARGVCPPFYFIYL